MLEKCAEALTDWLIRNNAIKNADRELYVYAAHSIFLSILPLFMAILLGGAMGKAAQSIFLVLPFMVIRKYSGGYHAKNPRSCLICSWLILFMFIYALSYVNWNFNLLTITIFSTISLWIFSPIDSDNRRLENDEKKRYKSSAVMMTIFWWIVASIFLHLQLYSYACSLALGITMAAFLQVPCILKNKQINNKTTKY
jgi:accessory gene regulator B